MAKILSLIVAVAADNGIGYKNDLLTHISADLKRFKQITSGHAIIMGRNTWLSLPKRPLPNRTNIVLTSQSGAIFESAVVVHSLAEALAACPDNQESFVIGGATIYEQFFPLVQKLYLTKIHHTFPADTFLPEINEKEWNVVSNTPVTNDEQAGVSYSFVDLERK
ncbi:MAG: dihydrofolate reductase [Salinivirgaceae bacterium]